MIPATVDLKLYRGDSFSFFFRYWEEIDLVKTYVVLTGTPEGDIKAAKGAAEPVITAFTCTLSDQLTFPGGTLVELTPAQSLLLPNVCVYDIQLVQSVTSIRTLVSGTITVTDQVTA